jgi:hypothetical protein
MRRFTIDSMKKKIYELTPLEKLQEVARMVGVQHVDICPEYSAFIECVYGVVNSCGESGFDALWDICSQHPDMTREKLRKTFDACSRSTRHGNSIGTLLYHARQAGVTFGREWGEAEFRKRMLPTTSGVMPNVATSVARATTPSAASLDASIQAFQDTSDSAASRINADFSENDVSNGNALDEALNSSENASNVACCTDHPRAYTRTRDNNIHQSTMDMDADLTISNELENEFVRKEEEVKHRPSLLPAYQWPELLRRLMDCGQSDGQRDVILLSTLSVIGSTVGKMLGFEYAQGGTRYSCLQTFIIGAPASGKSAMMLARHFAEPLNGKLLSESKKAKAKYEEEHTQWLMMGKDKAGTPEPKEPPLRMFIVPGNNSASGLITNLSNNGGLGLMVEAEASIIGGTYRQDWGDYSAVPRVAFDHDPLTVHRQTNNDFKMVEKVFFSMLISGTPGQVAGIARSRENGQLSRQVYYHIFQDDEGWKDPFEEVDGSVDRFFVRMGKRWEVVRSALEKEISYLEFGLTKEQQNRFNIHFAQLFAKSGNDMGPEGQSVVARLAINLMRLMSVATLLRALDGLLMDETREVTPEGVRSVLLQSGLAQVPTDVSVENTSDRITPRLRLGITDDDMDAFLGLSGALYEHSVYTMELVPKEEVRKSEMSSAERFKASLPLEFDLKKAYALGEEVGLKQVTVRSYLSRLVKKEVLEAVSEGCYRYVSKISTRKRKCVNKG